MHALWAGRGYAIANHGNRLALPRSIIYYGTHHGMDGSGYACLRPKRAEYERWRTEYAGADESTRESTKPTDIAYAESILGIMERFNYPSLKALRKESAELFQLLEIESYGYKRDEKEKIAEQETEIALLKAQNNGQ